MKKQINKNSTKKIGEYLTLKEARKALVEKEHIYGHRHWGNWFYPEPIYQEFDGTFSIKEPVIAANAKFIEAVDARSGRRFYRVKYHGEWKYASKKKIQSCNEYRGYGIIFPD